MGAGGLEHFGVYVYSEGFSSRRRPGGDRMLIENLWYYDDEYYDPQYDKTIEAMIRRNKYVHPRGGKKGGGRGDSGVIHIGFLSSTKRLSPSRNSSRL